MPELHEGGLNFDQVKVDLKTHRTSILDRGRPLANAGEGLKPPGRELHGRVVIPLNANDKRSIARVPGIDNSPGLLVVVQKSIGLMNDERRAAFFNDAIN